MAALGWFTSGVLGGAIFVILRLALLDHGRKKAQATNERAVAANLIEAAKFRANGELLRRPAQVRLANANQFLMLWNADLVTALHMLSTPSTPWTRKLHARLLALTIYESTKRLADFLDKNWTRQWSPRRAMIELGIGDDVEAEFDHLHHELSKLVTQSGPMLEGIRLNVIAHRDQNAANQLEWLESTNPAELEALGWQLLAWTTKAIGCFANAAVALRLKSERENLVSA